MQSRQRKLTLTPEHLTCSHRDTEDTGPTPGVQQQTNADYDAWVARILDTHPAPGAPNRLFADGSLIWKPEIDHVAEQDGTARGRHRGFCLRMPRFRGTPELPG